MKKQSRLFLKVVKAALKLAESSEKSKELEKDRQERLMGYSTGVRPGGTLSEEKPPLRNSGEGIIAPRKMNVPGTTDRIVLLNYADIDRPLSEENKSLRAEVEKLRRTINRKNALIETFRASSQSGVFVLCEENRILRDYNEQKTADINKLIEDRLYDGALLRKQAAEIEKLKDSLLYYQVEHVRKVETIVEDAVCKAAKDLDREQELRKTAGKKSKPIKESTLARTALLKEFAGDDAPEVEKLLEGAKGYIMLIDGRLFVLPYRGTAERTREVVKKKGKWVVV